MRERFTAGWRFSLTAVIYLQRAYKRLSNFLLERPLLQVRCCATVFISIEFFAKGPAFTFVFISTFRIALATSQTLPFRLLGSLKFGVSLIRGGVWWSVCLLGGFLRDFDKSPLDFQFKYPCELPAPTKSLHDWNCVLWLLNSKRHNIIAMKLAHFVINKIIIGWVGTTILRFKYVFSGSYSD